LASKVELTAVERQAERNLLVAPMPLVTTRGSQILGAFRLMDRAERGMATGAEFTSSEQRLADAIGVLVGSFIGTTQLAELRKELEVGRTIQNALLPAEPPRVAGFDIAGRYRQARHVGGDYFDFIRSEDDALVAVIADVSGHNLASGMMMVMARALLRSIASKNLGPSEVLAQLSSALFQDLMKNERFITSFLVRLREGERSIDYANAGHNPPLVWRDHEGRFETLEAEGTLVGFIADQEFEQKTAHLEPGDILVLYTDGITEATSASGEMFGEQRLSSVIAEARSCTAREILDRIFKAVAEFADGEGDDVTAVVIRAVVAPRALAVAKA
jgi:serine phosphatase RsbU (regulator of sigma subunit)